MKSLILILVVYSFDSLAMSWLVREPKELKEIKLSGDYYPGNSEDKESFTTERFNTVYCYKEILDEDREKAIVLNPNLRMRMYDREGNLLAEDVLRDRGPGEHFPSRSVVAYLPYLNNGDVSIRIVHLEGDREVLIHKELNKKPNIVVFSKERLQTNHDLSQYLVEKDGSINIMSIPVSMYRLYKDGINFQMMSNYNITIKGISLPCYRSGVDVWDIWSALRDKIKEHPNFSQSSD